MTLLEKIKNLIWFNNPIKTKEILLEMLGNVVSLQTDVEDLQNNPQGGGIQTISGDYVDNTDPQNIILNDPRPYKVFTALLEQTGTADPVVNVLENTIGTILVIRSGVGDYKLKSSGLFTLSKTTCMLNPGRFYQYLQSVTISDSSTINFNTYAITSGNPASDGALYLTPIEVRVY